MAKNNLKKAPPRCSQEAFRNTAPWASGRSLLEALYWSCPEVFLKPSRGFLEGYQSSLGIFGRPRGSSKRAQQKLGG